MSKESNQLIEVRSVSVPGLILAGLGGFMLLMWLILSLLPQKNAPPFPGSQYVVLIISLPMLLYGIYLLRTGKILMTLGTKEICFPESIKPLPLAEISNVDAVKIHCSDGVREFLLLNLTEAGKQCVPEFAPSFPELNELEPNPDFSHQLDYFAYGSLESSSDFVQEVVRRREAAMSGEPLPAPPEIPLTDRDTSETGTTARHYVHDVCGGATLVTDDSFRWVVNPMRLAGGKTMCAHCGEAWDHEVRWIETGETISKFRKRMWRITPFTLKLMQFLILPAIVGVLLCFLAPGAAKVPRMHRHMIGFALGFGGTNFLIWFTPLANILPTFFGMRYNRYL